MPKSSQLILLLAAIFIICCNKSADKRTYTITATVSGNGTINPKGVTKVTGGSTMTFFITPDEGYAITSIIVDYKVVPLASEYKFSNISADHIISVTFERMYSITISSDTHGIVRPSGMVSALAGSSILLQFEAADKYHTDSIWVDGIPQLLDGDYEYHLDKINADHVIRVSFRDGMLLKDFEAARALIVGQWKLYKIEYKIDENLFTTWDPYPTQSCEADDYEVYGGAPDYLYKSYQNGTICPGGSPDEVQDSGVWELDRSGKTLTLHRTDGSHPSIDFVSVTKDSFVTIFHGTNHYEYKYTNVH